METHLIKRSFHCPGGVLTWCPVLRLLAGESVNSIDHSKRQPRCPSPNNRDEGRAKGVPMVTASCGALRSLWVATYLQLDKTSSITGGKSGFITC